MFKKNDFSFLSTYLLAKELQKNNVQVEKINPRSQASLLMLRYRNKLGILAGQRLPNFDFGSSFICNNKEATRIFLKKRGIKTTEGKLFEKKELGLALKYIKRIGFPVVIKPVDGTWGKDVFLDINNIKSAVVCVNKILKTKNSFLVEKQFKGNEYRILATKEKLLGIINRLPANVLGDGKSTIKTLIDKKNADPRRGYGHTKSLVKIVIDAEIIENLKNQKLTLRSIPKKQERIFLRKNSNLSTGGDSIDVTDLAHPKIKKLAPEIIKAIPGLPYAGFDFLTTNIAEDPQKNNYAVIEINDSPMISMHHIPYTGKKRNVAREIVDLFLREF